jgi:hypothetical protein
VQVLEKLVCRFAPPFFLGSLATHGRTAGQPTNRSHQNLPKTDPTEVGRQHSPRTRARVFLSLSPLVFSRPVRDRSPRSLASLSLSLSLSLMSTARHSSPKPPENRFNGRRQAAQPKDQSFSSSLSPRLVPSATDPRESRFARSLSLSSVYCAALFPNPRVR